MYINPPVDMHTMKIFSYRESAILRALSEDSKTSIRELTDLAHCSRITATKELKKLKSAYDIRFSVEVDEDALGLVQRHLLIVRLDKKPKLKELVEIFKDDPYTDNIYLCKGSFDLIIHAVTSDPMSYIVWESLLPGKLGDYGVNIYPSELMHTNFGYFPIAKATISKFAKGIDDTDRSLLMLLAEDSSASMSGLSRALKIRRNTLYYRLFTLKKSGIIKRFTLSVNKPPFGYILAYAVNYRFNSTSFKRSVRMMEYYKSYDEGFPLMSTFQLLAPMSGSYRFLGIGLFEDRADAMKNAIAAHKSIFTQEDPDIKHARITGIVKGSFPFRSIDIKSNYTRFRWSEADLKER